MDHVTVIHQTGSENLEALERYLKENGFRIFVIDGDSISDAESFFSQIVSVLPLDPPLSGKVNWDAFRDSLWFGVDGLEETSVAIMWINCENIVEHDYQSFRTAVECFEDVALSIASEESGVDTPTRLLVFLIGYEDDLNVTALVDGMEEAGSEE
jgi:hypothetical protein